MYTLDTLITLQVAFIESHELSYAFGTLLIYDYIICFGEEFEYFWTRSWSLSTVLYLLIRYMSLGFASFMISVDHFSFRGTTLTSRLLLIKLFVFVIPITILCQSVITLRVWFLFSRNLAIKTLAVAVLIAGAVASILLLALQWNSIQFTTFHPQTSSSRSFAWIYVPSLLTHSILFALKVYRFFTSSVRMQTDSLLWGFIKEGMFMYVFAMASILFGVVGLLMVEPSQLSVRLPAGVGSPIVTAVVVSVCRVMLSIRSVAATAHVDPEWLLNHAELSRVHWRRGAVDGEIIVEAGDFTIPSDTKYPQSSIT